MEFDWQFQLEINESECSLISEAELRIRHKFVMLVVVHSKTRIAWLTTETKLNYKWSLRDGKKMNSEAKWMIPSSLNKSVWINTTSKEFVENSRRKLTLGQNSAAHFSLNLFTVERVDWIHYTFRQKIDQLSASNFKREWIQRSVVLYLKYLHSFDRFNWIFSCY